MAEYTNLTASDAGTLVVKVFGKLNASAASAVEDEIDQILRSNAHDKVVLDCDELTYISSMGLRQMLVLSRKENLEIVNVQPTVWEVFEMTGFTKIMKIRKAFREISVEGCRMLGAGANGTVYRLDAETIVKLYREDIPLDYVEKERGYAQSAFVAGVPTAISYDIVRCGKQLGIVFELIDAVTFDRVLIEQQEKRDEKVRDYVSLLRCFHSSIDEKGMLPRIKDRFHEWIDCMRNDYTYEELAIMHQVVDAVPDACTLVHGDFHPRNIMCQNGELIMIDMADVSVGSPLFDLAGVGLTHKYYPTTTPGTVNHFMGLTADYMLHLWDDVLRLYFPNADERKLALLEHTILMITSIRVAVNPAIVLGLEDDFRAGQVAYGKRFCADRAKEALSLVAEWNAMCGL